MEKNLLTQYILHQKLLRKVLQKMMQFYQRVIEFLQLLNKKVYFSTNAL